jgi:hypothetical protein
MTKNELSKEDQAAFEHFGRSVISSWLPRWREECFEEVAIIPNETLKAMARRLLDRWSS